VSWLDLVERLGRLPAEAWLVPPVVIIAGIVAIGVMLHRARLRRYRAIAARTGLAVKASIVNASQVHGAYSGRRLVMSIASARPPGFFRKTWTRVFAEVRNPRFVALRLRRRDVIDRLLRLGNAPVGDAEFDRRFLVLSRDPGYVMMIFSDRTLRELFFQADIQRVHLVSSSLEVFYRRDVRDPEHAARLFDATVRLADAVDMLESGRY
jgi:hypothetical protein